MLFAPRQSLRHLCPMKRSRNNATKSKEKEEIVEEEAEKRSKLADNLEETKHELSTSSTHQQQHVADNAATSQARVCPYLDTVNRELLDFDFEKKCSISLSTTNVYCCLVCGKYFQGRTFTTHAGQHSVEEDHHVFVNMQNRKIYCLPEDYEVFAPSLADIQHNVNPTILQEDIAYLDTKEVKSRTLDNRQAIQGVVAMNNLHSGDAANAVLQCLVHLPRLRNYLLSESFYHDDRPASELLVQLANLTKRVWNSSPWRATVSPHELLHEIALRSGGKFGVGVKSDPIEFYSWLVNTLHNDLAIDAKKRGVKRASSTTIIAQLFRGQVSIQTEKLTRKKGASNPSNQHQNSSHASSTMEIDNQAQTGANSSQTNQGVQNTDLGAQETDTSLTTTKIVPFFYLQLDLPTVTLLKDEKSKTASLQVPIYTLLSKYDGHTKQFIATSRENRMCKIEALPEYLAFFVKRFTQNMYLIEKNKTIVNFPVDELDMTEYTTETENTKYNLSAYICHTGDTANGSCLSRFFHKANGKWYNSQEGSVDDLQAELHFVAEAYILFYERCR